MLLLSRMRSVCIQLNMNVIRGLVKRAQLLWHVHNCWETCTTSLKRAHIEYLKTLGGAVKHVIHILYIIYTYNYIYTYVILNVYIYILYIYSACICIWTCVWFHVHYCIHYIALRYGNDIALYHTTLHCIALHFHSIAYTNKHTCVTYINYCIYIYIARWHIHLHWEVKHQ